MHTPRQRLLPLLAAALLAAAAGCASPRGYFADRGRDAADVVTFSFGTGAGVTARVGPGHVGLFYGSDACGLRGGQAGMFRVPCDDALAAVHAGAKIWQLDAAARGRMHTMDGSLVLLPLCAAARDGDIGSDNGFDMAVKRGRREADVVAGHDRLCFWVAGAENHRAEAWYYSQIEAAVGAGGTLRAGLNLFELADFFCGWFGLDFSDDDASVRGKKALSPS